MKFQLDYISQLPIEELDLSELYTELGHVTYVITDSMQIKEIIEQYIEQLSEYNLALLKKITEVRNENLDSQK